MAPAAARPCSRQRETVEFYNLGRGLRCDLSRRENLVRLARSLIWAGNRGDSFFGRISVIGRQYSLAARRSVTPQAHFRGRGCISLLDEHYRRFSATAAFRRRRGISPARSTRVTPKLLRRGVGLTNERLVPSSAACAVGIDGGFRRGRWNRSARQARRP